MAGISSARKVLFVGWEGADWGSAHRMVDKGELPQLSNSIENGTIGTVAGFSPYDGGMLWSTVGSGMLPHQHGVAGASCDASESAFFWNVLSHHKLPVNVIAWPFTQYAEPIEGDFISDAFVHDGSLSGQDGIYSKHRYEILSALRMRPEEVDRRLLPWLVGDVSEEVLQKYDHFLKRLLVHLAAFYTTHNCAVQTISDAQSVVSFVNYGLIDAVQRDIAALLGTVPDSDIDFLNGVVDGAYRLQDLILQDLLGQSGEGTSLVLLSTHGFKNHRLHPHGLFAMAGPDVKRDEIVHGVQLVDICPTLLHYLDLPVGRDMAGVVRSDLFSSSRPVEFVDSWDGSRGDGHRRPAGHQKIERVDYCCRLGTALFYLDRVADALPWLDEAHFIYPEHQEVAFMLVKALLQLGLLSEAEEVLEVLKDHDPKAAPLLLLQAHMQYLADNLDEALAVLGGIDEPPNHLRTAIMDQRAFIELKRGSGALAKKTFCECLELDSVNAMGWMGLARAEMMLGNLDEAINCSQRAIGLRYEMPLAHFTLAQCHEASGADKNAETSYSLACQFAKGFEEAEAGIKRCRFRQTRPEKGVPVRLSRGFDFSGCKKNPVPVLWDLSVVQNLRERLFEQRAAWRRIRDENRSLPECMQQVGEYTVRSAFTDEIPRLGQMLPKAAISGKAELLVVVADHPERIVAAGVLPFSSTESGRTQDSVVVGASLRYQKNPIISKLISLLLTQSVHSSSLTCAVRASQKWLIPVLEEHGFKSVRILERWRGPTKAMLDRVERVAPRLEKRLKAEGIEFQSILLEDAEAEYGEEIAAIIASNQLQSNQRILENRAAARYIGNVSNLSLVNGQPAGVALLGKIDEQTTFYDVRAIAPGFQHLSNLINGAMMAYSCRKGFDQGYVMVEFYSDNLHWKETRNLAVRCGYQLIGEHSVYVKAIN